MYECKCGRQIDLVEAAQETDAAELFMLKGYALAIEHFLTLADCDSWDDGRCLNRDHQPSDRYCPDPATCDLRKAAM